VNLEAQVITSVCKNKDIGVLFSENVDFLFESHSDIWAGIKSYYLKYKAVPDVELVAERYPDFLADEAPGQTEYLVDKLRNEFLTNRIRTSLASIGSTLKSGQAPQIVIEEMMRDVAELERYTSSVRDLNITDYEAAARHYEQVKEHADAMGGSVGIPLGIKSIDYSYPTGMAPGHLIVVIGWPGRGKSWWTAWVAAQAWRLGFKPLIVSLEMSPETMRDRIYTVIGAGEFKNSDLVRGHIDIDDFKRYGEQHFADKPDFIVVSNQGYASVTPNLIQGKIEQYKPDLVIVDYHQLMDDNRNSENATVRNMNVSRELKRLATRNNIPVIDITAATAEEQSDRKDPPMLHHVAWSKAIEYDADMAMAVHKEPESDIMEIVCRKNRHGSEFGLFLNWDINSGVIEETFHSE
jgi:replicative DNA helicase